MKVRIRYSEVYKKYYIQKKSFLFWHDVTSQLKSGDLECDSSWDDVLYFYNVFDAEQIIERFKVFLDAVIKIDPIHKTYDLFQSKRENYGKLLSELRKTEVGSDEEKEILTKLGLI